MKPLSQVAAQALEEHRKTIHRFFEAFVASNPDETFSPHIRVLAAEIGQVSNTLVGKLDLIQVALERHEKRVDAK